MWGYWAPTRFIASSSYPLQYWGYGGWSIEAALLCCSGIACPLLQIYSFYVPHCVYIYGHVFTYFSLWWCVNNCIFAGFFFLNEIVYHLFVMIYDTKPFCPASQLDLQAILLFL
jgi:hypothetical protein